ncbi:hypothetical protein RSO01_89790 [Reyranella soli]|uniref:Uncharacterized protein n=1 Tax=Reyranella soli TaxID=1230389 RepID=A0A512NS98_9HYPH|nr:hypothetical protein RSO01_89790 [Reyranella soli]
MNTRSRRLIIAETLGGVKVSNQRFQQGLAPYDLPKEECFERIEGRMDFAKNREVGPMTNQSGDYISARFPR